MKRSIGFILMMALLMSIILLAGGGDTAVSAQTQQPQSSDGGPTIVANPVASGFSAPVAIANAGDNRLFIVEQGGLIKIIDTDQTVLSQNFLDISSLVSNCLECGLLGLAFHPDFNGDSNRYFYVNYTTPVPRSTVIARYEVDANDPNKADTTTRTELLRIPQPYTNHNGGDLIFGPDGYLYIGMGDGGDSYDTDWNGQDPGTLLGGMLRIDVDAQTGGAPDCGSIEGGGTPPYTVPADNPFVADADSKCDEIWATGLRNPWRFSFDAETGDLYIGDVGQGALEEVDFQPASSSGGENYGWGCKEGTNIVNSITPPCDDAGVMAAMIDPFAEFGRSDARAITGGYVYRGSDYPGLVGFYIFADYALSNFWTAQYNDPVWDVNKVGTIGVSNPSSFGEGCDNELYVASLGGTIYQIGTAVPRPPLGTPILDKFVYLPIVIGGSGVVACN